MENSWGDERGEKGYLVLSSDWFREFVFEVVVDRKFVPDDVLKVFEQEPVVLPAWDPMGTLAHWGLRCFDTNQIKELTWERPDIKNIPKY